MAGKKVNFKRAYHGDMNCRKCLKPLRDLICFSNNKVVSRKTTSKRGRYTNVYEDRKGKNTNAYYCVPCAERLNII